MCYRGGRGVVPPAGIRPGQMIVKFRWWPRNIATQMYLGNVNAIQAWQTTEIYDMSWKHLTFMISLLSGGSSNTNIIQVKLYRKLQRFSLTQTVHEAPAASGC